MNSDHHFVIGRSHTVCEDYAASQGGFAALSDGCSCVTGEHGRRISAHTDIGARLLVRAAFHHQVRFTEGEFAKLVLHTADGYRRQMDLASHCLSATLLAIGVADSRVFAMIHGDGVIAARNRQNGLWDCYQYYFDGPPIYLRYLLVPDCPKPTTRLVVTEVFRELEMDFGRDTTSLHGFGLGTFDLVVAMSDGAFSFTKNSVPIPFNTDLALRLLDFRGLKGEFIKRHLTGVLREMAQDGIVNQDDISMIAIHV